MAHATIEWVYVGVVISILTYVGSESWNVERIIEHAPEDAETIKVTAQQWFWTFEHEDGKKEVGELHVTRGVPYKFEVVSMDVNHAFNVPDYTMLIDAIPGRVNTIWNMFDKSGEFLIQCREYCGLLHYNMKAKLFVEEPTAQTAEAKSPSTQKPPAREESATTGSVNNKTNTTSTTTTTTNQVPTQDALTLTMLQGAAVQGNPAYEPDPLIVKKGDTILTENKDTAPHTVTNGKGPDDPASGKLFDTSIIEPGKSANVDISKLSPGREYSYYCAVHPYMKGVLKVQ